MMGKQVTTPKKKQDKKKPRQKRAAPGKRKRFSLPPNSIPGKMQADLYGFIHDKMERLQRADRKKLFLLNFPYLLFAYVCNKICWLYRVSSGGTAWDKCMETLNYFERAFENPIPSFYYMDVFYGILGGIAVKLIVCYRAKNAKKYRQGVEYGSARWGTEKDIQPYVDPVFEENIILTETERLMMSGRPKEPKYARNKNILVIGGSGSGKTRFFVKPNLMQMHSSYVVTDPKGTVLVEVGHLLARGSPMTDENGKIIRDKEGKVVYEPYKIKVLNTINFKKSMHYNPFVYIRSEKDILKLVTTIIANTKGEGQQSGEDFWVKAEKLYYCALIGYIWYEGREEEKNFNTLLALINASEAREDDENFKNPVGLETMIVSLCMKIISVLITVILYGRMIEIYLYVSVSPIPFATFTNREWGSIGNNYVKALLGLGFQGFFMMVCVAIYAVLVNTITVADNLHTAIWSVAAYTVILCFSLFKTGSLSKSIFNAH